MGKQPDFIAQLVREWTDKEGKEQSSWTRLGGAFKNKDGSISIPLEGKIILQLPKEDDADNEADAGAAPI